VGVTTLLHQFGLGELLDFLLDDNPVRHGLMSPGYRLPVLPSRALYERRPDYVLLLAWQYAEPIIAKHALYRREGGRFVLPLPDVAVI